MRVLRTGKILAGVVLWAAVTNGHAGEAVLAGPGPDLIRRSAAIADPGEKIADLSRSFLEVPYRAATLGGGPGLPERLTVELAAVDCFTLLDYVEAMRRSVSADTFAENLARVRYRDGTISWRTRKHFFSDWMDDPLIADATVDVGDGAAQTVTKTLNRHAAGGPVLEGVEIRERLLHFIPADVLAEKVDRLQNGDYIGILAEPGWLDVTHVGILIRKDGRVFLRHASSHPAVGRVVDTDLLDYLAGKPGIIVLRARPR